MAYGGVDEAAIQKNLEYARMSFKEKPAMIFAAQFEQMALAIAHRNGLYVSNGQRLLETVHDVSKFEDGLSDRVFQPETYQHLNDDELLRVVDMVMDIAKDKMAIQDKTRRCEEAPPYFEELMMLNGGKDE